MDYEKKYKEAINRAKAMVKVANSQEEIYNSVITIFPELKESEDKMIREYLIRYIDNTMKSSELKSKLLAWLEKQGKQKPTLRERYKNIAESEWFKKTHDGMSVSDDEKVNNVNKIEQKFKVGDWITNGACIIQIASVDDTYYWHDNDFVGGDIESMDKEYHLWTIEDAKDGDVLAFDNNTIVIFKDLYNATTFHSYCYIEDGLFGVSKDEMPDWWEGKGFHPATKEQRDLLFQKMHEAGYEWDDEKKELKKINEQHLISNYFNAEYERGKSDALKSVAWSEDDEKIIKRIDSLLYAINENDFEDIHAWLKSLKNRALPQSKQEWSKEDDDFFNDTITFLEMSKNALNHSDFLKSLKQRCVWKPSDEQMHAFKEVYDWYNNNFAPSETLTSLYDDLMKLK